MWGFQQQLKYEGLIDLDEADARVFVAQKSEQGAVKIELSDFVEDA